MEKPYKYTIICNKTGKIEQTNIEPLPHHLETWEQTQQPNIKVKKQTKTCWIDTQYEAKLRIYNYITFTKRGLKIPQYKPFENTEIGKSLPILNF